MRGDLPCQVRVVRRCFPWWMAWGQAAADLGGLVHGGVTGAQPRIDITIHHIFNS
jgi:hypothetical protein